MFSRVCSLAAALAVAACAGAAFAQDVTRDIYYTRTSVGGPLEKDVKRATVKYNRTTHALTISNITDIAIVPGGADGIVFAADGDLLVGGQTSNLLYKLNKTTGIGTSQPVGAGGFHMKLDPNSTKAWITEHPGKLSEVPLNPFAPGTPHSPVSDDTAISDIAFAGGRAFYTSSGTVGSGKFGVINLNSYFTTRVLNNEDAAHGLFLDNRTGHLILVGRGRIVQVDPSTPTPTVVSFADLAGAFPGINLDQGVGDGTGLLYIASADGRLVVMDYAATQRVGTSTSTIATAPLDTFLGNIALAPAATFATCCDIGSGDFDHRSAQQSQLPGLPGAIFDYRVADDFYLLPDRIYKINSLEATLITDSTIPKARLELYEDCAGLPADPPFMTVLDASSITDTGTLFEGKKVYSVKFNFTDFWLKGGKSYWASFIGKGLGSNNELWFWGTAGNGFTVQGRPGAWKSSTAGQLTWKSIDGFTCPTCIGCTDFAFCVNATSCKILNDNGTYAPAGTISLDGPAGITYGRSADDFVVPPCADASICYIEAYVATNCVSTAVSIYDNSCNLPSSLSPLYTLLPSKIVNTGQTANIGGQNLPILCLQFWNVGITLPGGKQYWISALGIGDGTPTQVAYFLYNQDCRRPCLVRWNGGAGYGPFIGQPTWVKGATAFGSAHDYAFLIAMTDPSPPFGLPGGGTAPSCPVDTNNNGRVEVQDIFLYLSSWFAGC